MKSGLQPEEEEMEEKTASSRSPRTSSENEGRKLTPSVRQVWDDIIEELTGETSEE